MAANVNWFSKVEVDAEGNLSLDAQNKKPGAAVTLRFEMDTLVILHTCPHPLNQAEQYPRIPVNIKIFKSDSVQDDDYCMNFRPENKRGFENNRLYYLD